MATKYKQDSMLLHARIAHVEVIFLLENDQWLYNEWDCHLVDFILASWAEYHLAENNPADRSHF